MLSHHPKAEIEEFKKIDIETVRKDAERGNANAQLALGDAYYDGNGVEKNEKMAAKWYQKAATLGHREARYNLGRMYENGEGIKKDAVKAAKWYQKAALRGCEESQFNLGNLYENGEGVTKDAVEAVKWYRKAALQEHMAAQYNLGVMYQRGVEIEKNEVEAMRWYQKAAINGNADAKYCLGIMWEYGQGIEKNEKKAVAWYQSAATQKHLNAQYKLGTMYQRGLGIEKNELKAAECYQQAAEEGHGFAQFNLGMMYEHGLDREGKSIGNEVKKNEKMAVKWYQKAAEQKDSDAQYFLGMMYQRGLGIEKNEKKAMELFKMAAAEGNSAAHYIIGVIYHHGKNKKEAAKWFQKAANLKHPKAMLALKKPAEISTIISHEFPITAVRGIPKAIAVSLSSSSLKDEREYKEEKRATREMEEKKSDEAPVVKTECKAETAVSHPSVSEIDKEIKQAPLEDWFNKDSHDYLERLTRLAKQEGIFSAYLKLGLIELLMKGNEARAYWLKKAAAFKDTHIARHILDNAKAGRYTAEAPFGHETATNQPILNLIAKLQLPTVKLDYPNLDAVWQYKTSILFPENEEQEKREQDETKEEWKLDENAILSDEKRSHTNDSPPSSSAMGPLRCPRYYSAAFQPDSKTGLPIPIEPSSPLVVSGFFYNPVPEDCDAAEDAVQKDLDAAQETAETLIEMLTTLRIHNLNAEQQMQLENIQMLVKKAVDSPRVLPRPF